jgi:Ca2+-binding EF-hand superfamily protein
MANRLPTLDLEVLPDQSMPPVARRPGRLDVELNEFGLDVQTLGGNVLARNLNAPFAAADADKSNFLEGDEQLRLLEALEMELGKVDRDGDRKISLEECLAATNRFTSYTTLVSSVQVARSTDPLFANLDADHDGRLTIRELRASGKQLSQLDRDGDGMVTPDEVPSRLSLTWSLGAVPRFDQAPRMLNPATAPRSDLPGWMQAMDRNGDGELSPREFLGTRAQFQRLDVDGDGLVSADEARAAASAGP